MLTKLALALDRYWHLQDLEDDTVSTEAFLNSALTMSRYGEHVDPLVCFLQHKTLERN